MTPEQEAEYREYVVGHTHRLCRFAYLCCGDWHRAEDAVQTAFVKLYAGWHRARRRSLDAYVRRIVVHNLVDEQRLFRFRRERATAALPDRAAPEANRPEERLVLIEALLRLPKRQRAAVVLRFWEDRSVEETAHVLGCSTGAAKNLTMRGLAALRALLADTPLARIEGVTP